MSARPPRLIACVRCRRRKKRCDRAVPSCGECTKTGSDCVPVGLKTNGNLTTVPTAYLQQLESRMADLQRKTQAQTQTQSLGADADTADDHGQVQQESSYPSPFDNSNNENSESGSGPAGDPLPREESVDNVMVFDGDDAMSNLYSPSQSIPDLQAQSQPTASGINRSQPQHDLASIGSDWLDHYAEVYFRHAQPQWSFLDEDDWNAKYQAWMASSGAVDDTHVFILLLALAVGALLSSSYRQNCPYLTHASLLYETAIRDYLGSITQHQSALTRTQASMLMVIYSWHDSSHNILQNSIMMVLLNCQNLIDQMRTDQDKQSQDTAAVRSLQRRCVMSCHIVNEIVSSAWSYPQSFVLDTLDDKMFQYASQMKADLESPDFYERLFQLRCIQSKIRHANKKLRLLDPSDPFRESFHHRLKTELQDWKTSIQLFTSSTPSDEVVYHETQALLKLYDYGVSILMQENLSILSVQDIGQLIECCSEACRTFRQSQQSNPLIYWTWTALMYQFRLGVMLLYCYFITPRTMQTPVFSYETTLDGIQSCRLTLENFSARWPQSMVYLHTFQLLADKTFEASYSEAIADQSALESPEALTRCLTSGSSGEWITNMEAAVTELKSQHVHHAVVALILDMIKRSSVENFNMEAIGFVPNLDLDSLGLFGFCVPT
ncbi:hypothetical protein FACUT_8603 [Fusarium acutatum]|uniref:Zn(2)-C6 fungal-type domain-containing protein n=1 Tax=Fusarium acutatum TaxID=78861 RepID=A0A8H4JMB3_9HYPO|nr:hypothetical protein FACUT_8603 [Fusarium acutatum]